MHDVDQSAVITYSWKIIWDAGWKWHAGYLSIDHRVASSWSICRLRCRVMSTTAFTYTPKRSMWTASSGSPSALVSVIIPTRNRAALLLRAIESVQRQTYRNLEIIVVDDASTDETRTVVERLTDPRICYLRHAVSRGGSAARNAGIKAATGEYIAFLDDDDEWEPQKTEVQLGAFEGYGAVVCTSNQRVANLKKYAAKEVVELEDLRRGKFTAGGTGILMAKASVLRETMFDESLPRYQDWDLFIRIAMNHEIRYLNEPLVRYNSGAHHRITNSGRRLSLAQIEQRVCMLQKHREFLGPRWFRRHMCRALLAGLKDRRNKIQVLMHAVRRYGLLSVAHAVGRRVWAILYERAPG